VTICYSHVSRLSEMETHNATTEKRQFAEAISMFYNPNVPKTGALYWISYQVDKRNPMPSSVDQSICPNARSDNPRK